jgi:hypothetical protein
MLSSVKHFRRPRRVGKFAHPDCFTGINVKQFHGGACVTGGNLD